MAVEQFISYLQKLNEKFPFQVATHSTESKNNAESILQTGLCLKPAVSTLDANVFRFGKVSDAIQDYRFLNILKNGVSFGKYSVIVAFPNQIGFQAMDYEGFNQDDARTEADVLILRNSKYDDPDRVLASRLPVEFILGYFDSNSETFKLNSKFILFQSEEVVVKEISECKQMIENYSAFFKIFDDYKNVKWNPYCDDMEQVK